VKVIYSLLGYMDREPAGAAQIEARNRGDMLVRVTGAGFNVQDDRDNVVHIIPGRPGRRCRG
jgi:hypothetical protein